MSESPKRRLRSPSAWRLRRIPRAGLTVIEPRPAVATIAIAAGTAVILTAAFVALVFALPLAIAVLAIMAVVRPIGRRVRWSIRAWRAHRLLSGDWWHDFERDLKAYTEPSAYRARHRERRL